MRDLTESRYRGPWDRTSKDDARMLCRTSEVFETHSVPTNSGSEFGSGEF